MDQDPERSEFAKRYGDPSRALGGRYVIERTAGSGGMATVYLARDLKHGRQVALKVLRSELGAYLSAERFQREIHIAAGLTHPHILPVHDSGADDGLLYYVMPFVAGETLDALLAREGPLDLDRVFRYTREIASALQYAHDHGIIHRDIKPANILIANDVSVVADFGLARAIAAGSDAEKLTSPGIGLGTPRYMSPEQGLGDVDVDVRTDQYSLACVVFEMLAGRPPFTGDSFMKLLTQHLSEPPSSVRQYRPDAWESIDETLTRALSKKPEDRFASVIAFERALSGMRTTNAPAVPTPMSGPMVVSPPATASRLRPWGRVAMFATAAVVLGIAAVVLWKGQAPGGPAGNSDLIAVAPFEVLNDPRLAVWREGLVDVLSRTLDGAGPLRTVAPSQVMRNVEPGARVDRGVAAQLASRTNSGLVVLGLLQSAGPDSVRATVSFFDAATDSVFGEIEARSANDRIDQLGDSIAVKLLRELGARRSIAAVPRAFFGSRSLPALKAFLQGEQLYRRNELDAARGQYEIAVQLDPGFAVALRRMRGVLRAQNESDPLSFVYAARAGAVNHGNTRRDSLLILADSLYAVHPNPAFYSGTAWLASVRRRAAVLERAAADFPEDPEIWTELGELRTHYNTWVRVTDREALDAFRRAIAIDSLWGPAYFHAIELAIPLEGSAAAGKLVQRYRRINPGDERFEFVERALTRLAPSEFAAAAARHGARFYSPIFSPLRRYRERPSMMIAALEAADAALPVATRATWLPAFENYYGRAPEALARLDRAMLPEQHWEQLLPILEESGLASADRERMVDVVMRTGTAQRASGIMALLTARADSSALRTAVAAGGACGRSNVPVLSDACRSLATTMLSLQRADTAASLRMLESLPDEITDAFPTSIRVLWARLLLARADPNAAARVLDAAPPPIQPFWASEIWWHAVRAEAAERIGDLERAGVEYRIVADVWAAATSPACRAAARHASARLARL